MHDNMIAVGMHWKVMHACSIAIIVVMLLDIRRSV